MREAPSFIWNPLGDSHCPYNPKKPTTTAFGNRCLKGAGGYFIILGFWCYIACPDEAIRRTLLYKKDNTDGLLVLINVLKFITVIINYCVSPHVITTTNVTEDPYPVILNITNNASAQSWTNHTCRISKIRRLIACLFLLLALYQLSTGHKFTMDQH